MRVFVLGGTGFVGRATVASLAARGAAVTAFHRGRTEASLPEGATAVHGDRHDAGDLRAALAQARPDVVLDAIAYTHAEARTTTDATRGHAVRLVLLSSQDVYRAYERFTDGGPPEPTPYAEAAPLRVRRYPYRALADGPTDGLYHYDKILVEEAARAAPDTKATVLRLPRVYGPHDPQRRFGGWAEALLAGTPVRITTAEAAWRWTGGYVENVADAIAAAALDDRTAGGTFNLGEAVPPTEQERVEALADALGTSTRVEIVADEKAPPSPLRGKHLAQPLVADTGQIRRTLGWTEPVDTPEALRRTAAWLRSA